MKVGDFMILNVQDQVGQAEVVVLNTLGQDCTLAEDYAWVRCACGSEVTVFKEDLRPAPRVYLDVSGRVALRVVEDEAKEDPER